MIRSFDANGDGTITANEVDERRKPFYERIVRGAGLDPANPIAVSALRESFKKRLESGEFRGGMRGGPPGQNGGPPGGPGQPKEQPKAEPFKSSIPGFGGQSASPAVQGFGASGTPAPAKPGTPGAPAPAAGTPPASPSGTASPTPAAANASPTPAPAGTPDPRFRQYAESLMRQYDKNKNGVLDKDEIAELRGGLRNADRNNDGTITLDELTLQVQDYGQRRSESSGPSGRSSSSTTTSASGGSRKSYRFLTATERLPSGLPDWFAQKDADGDGQVSMAEYTGSWNDSAVADFLKFDLNNDGIITPGECLRFQTKK